MDEKDEMILAVRQAAILKSDRPKQGDVIRFKNKVIRRMAHVYYDEDGKADRIQPTCTFDISFYLGEGYMEFSGSLAYALDAKLFTLAKETQEVNAWFFHHDWAKAHGGIPVKVNVPVWNCDYSIEGEYK